MDKKLVFGAAAIGAVLIGLLFADFYWWGGKEAAEFNRKLNAARVRDEKRTRDKGLREESSPDRACADLRRSVRDKRIGDLTVRETEMLSTCRALGY